MRTAPIVAGVLALGTAMLSGPGSGAALASGAEPDRRTPVGSSSVSPVPAAPAGSAGSAAAEVTVSEPRTIHENVAEPPDPSYASFPAIFDLGGVDASGRRTHDFRVSHNAGQDSVGGGVLQHLRSTDGQTFTPYAADPQLDLHTAVRRTDPGREVLVVGYEPYFDSETDPRETVDPDRDFPRYTYADGRWVPAKQPARVTVDEPVAVMRVHQGITTLPNGDLRATIYGTTADGRSYTFVIGSADGITWRQVGTIATGPGGRWTEAHLVSVPGETMVALVRFQNTTTNRLDLYQVRSRTADGSGTWAAPTEVATSAGAAPRLQPLGDGTLAALSGRLDNQLRISADGRGEAWSEPTTLYANHPVDAAPDSAERTLGSSGYLGVVATGPDQLLVVGDNCAGHWGCAADAGEFTRGTAKTLWAVDATVDPGLGRRLDLLDGFREGTVRFVDTTPVPYAKGQASLLPYAFDGDTSPASSLVTSDRTVTLDLGRAERLSALVVHASLVGPAGVRVETSTDGTTWSPIGAKPSGATYRLAEPVAARFVRVSDPNPASAETAAWSFLDDLQLYAA